MLCVLMIWTINWISFISVSCIFFVSFWGFSSYWHSNTINTEAILRLFFNQNLRRTNKVLHLKCMLIHVQLALHAQRAVFSRNQWKLRVFCNEIWRSFLWEIFIDTFFKYYSKLVKKYSNMKIIDWKIQVISYTKSTSNNFTEYILRIRILIKLTGIIISAIIWQLHWTSLQLPGITKIFEYLFITFGPTK